MSEIAVNRLKNQLEEVLTKNAVDHRRLHEILDHLCSIEMDLEMLQKTKIGLTVNKVRKEFKNAQPIVKKTSELVRKWKKVARDEIRVSISSDGMSEPNHSPNGQMLSPSAGKKGRISIDSTTSNGSPAVITLKSRVESHDSTFTSEETEPEENDPRPGSPKDPVRQKSVEMIEEAMKSHNSLSKIDVPVDVHMLALRTEKAIYRDLKETDRKYKSRVRSRVTNLRDEQNENLRQRVLRGLLSPKRLATLSIEDLANEKLKQLRRSITEEMRFEHELPDGGETHSSMFLCQECGDRDTSYTLSQERQDGEFAPIPVTLVVCNKCGHRWKDKS